MIDDTIIIINGEECKRIYGFNRMYYVSKNGNVYNNHLKMLKPGYDGGRYRTVTSPKQNSFHRDHILNKNLIGVNNHEAILTETDVKEIFYLHNIQKLSYVKLGNIYGVTSSAIRNIIKGKSWTHITGLKNTRKK